MTDTSNSQKNPYFQLADVLHELYWFAGKIRGGQKEVSAESMAHLNQLTSPWEFAEQRVRNESISHGIPFDAFDAALRKAWNVMQDLAQVAMGNESISFSVFDYKYVDAERRLKELGTTFAGANPTRGANTSLDDLGDRQKEILAVLLGKGADSQRKSLSRQRAARMADEQGRPSTYNHPIADLVKLGLVRSKKAAGGGIWLTEEGKAAAQSLREKTHQ